MWRKNFILDLLFPKFCLGCQKEGDYLCEDCKATLEVSSFHQKYSTGNLADLYFAVSYQKPLIKNLIQKFKYQPFVKELAKTLSSLIIDHFQLMEKLPDFSEFFLIPIPLEKKKLKQRGFNQTEEIAKELLRFLNIQILSNVLIKIKETLPQVELNDEERKENIKGAFCCRDREKVRGRKILLIDDVYTTGSTLEEAAKVLREAGAKEVLGIVVARG
ncbi:MAG: ComF family protein [Patescibacteria group bacterium]|nr:ComF family protein [Patescibacteria group bacterium]